MRDERAHSVCKTFYQAVARQTSPFNYHLAVDQAKSRMTGKGDSRKPARHKANGAVDFLCFLSINGDVKCKSRIEQKEYETGKQDKDKNKLKEQQILREDAQTNKSRRGGRRMSFLRRRWEWK